MNFFRRYIIAVIMDELNSIETVEEFNQVLAYSLDRMRKRSKDEEFINDLNDRCSLYEKKYITKEEFKECLTELLKKLPADDKYKNIEEIEALRKQNEQLKIKCSELEKSHSQLENTIVKLARQQEETAKNVAYNETLKQACIALKSEIDDLERRIAAASAVNHPVQPIPVQYQNIPVNQQPSENIYNNTKEYAVPTAEEKSEQKAENSQFELTANTHKVLLANTSNMMTIKGYLERYKKTDDIVSFLEENEGYENLAVYKKKIDRFNESINKTITSLLEKVTAFDEDKISEKVIEKMFRKVSDDIIKKIIPSVLKRIDAYNDEKYVDLMKRINTYLENVGIYTYNIAKVGEPMDNYTDYYDVVPIPMNRSELIGVIQQINVPPYLVNYKSEDEVDHFVTCGSINVYSEDH